MNNALPPNTFYFDARGVAERFRHAAIFGALESLEQGERMRFINDHDPLPLLYQIQHLYGKQVRIEYVERRAHEIVIDLVIAAPETVKPGATVAGDTVAAGYRDSARS